MGWEGQTQNRQQTDKGISKHVDEMYLPECILLRQHHTLQQRRRGAYRKVCLFNSKSDMETIGNNVNMSVVRLEYL